MTRQTLDPRDFAERLDRAFGTEPAHAPLDHDIRVGRRRLLRRRASVALGGLAVAAAVSGAVTLLPTTGVDRPRDLAPAAGGEASSPGMSRAEILDRCTTGENAYFLDGSGSVDERRAVALLGDQPRLMTVASIENRTHATLLSQDGSLWGDCQFRNAPDNGVKNALAVYPTTLELTGRTVAGVDAYEPVNEADERLVGGVSAPLPQLEVPCVSPLTDEERWAVDAQCPEFTLTWNDRRPSEVAAVKVVAPDGVASWADVRDGHVSFAYIGEMTPEISDGIARGEAPGARRIVFYDADGEVLVDDRDPGHVPSGADDISILNFPSLAVWLR